ncbi:hypothetical protein ACMC56_05595 [Campylobacterota bacterium DY0563]
MTTEELMDLMYTPIYDEKMLRVMEELETEVPKLDEKYELEGIASTTSKDNTLSFEYKELNGYSKNGEPSLKILSWGADSTIPYPYLLNKNDNYQSCCKKFGKKADFIDEWDDTLKTWLIELNNKKIHINITFSDEDLNSISYLVLTTYDETEIGEIYIPNEE